VYEIYALTTDELGSNWGPTGDGHEILRIAEDMLTDYRKRYPDQVFYLQTCFPDDYWNAC